MGKKHFALLLLMVSGLIILTACAVPRETPQPSFASNNDGSSVADSTWKWANCPPFVVKAGVESSLPTDSEDIAQYCVDAGYKKFTIGINDQRDMASANALMARLLSYADSKHAVIDVKVVLAPHFYYSGRIVNDRVEIAWGNFYHYLPE